jgi:exoribonuclease-2
VPPPYSDGELQDLAKQCTAREDEASRVERRILKSAIALRYEEIGFGPYAALVTGVTRKGTWVRVLDPPAEGHLATGGDGLDVGDRLSVRLVATDVEKGFIDFVPA